MSVRLPFRHAVHRAWPILLLAFMLLAGGVRRDLPPIREVDEPTFVGGAVNAVTGRPDPDWYGHPGSTFFYTLGGVLLGDRLLSGRPDTLPARFADGDPTLTLYGRLVNVWFGLLAVATLIRLSRRIFPTGGERIGRYGALFLAALPLTIEQLTIARTDGVMLFFATVSLYVTVDLFTVPTSRSEASACGRDLWGQITTRKMFFAGVIFGLAVATKYQLGLFFLLAAGILVAAAGRRGSLWSAVLPLAIMGLGGVLAFFAAAPFIFIDWQEALNQLIFESRSVHPGADGLSPPGNLLWYLANGLPRTLGPLLPFLAVGAGVVVTGRYRGARLLLLYTVLYLLLIALHPLHWQRWLLPILPALVLLAAAGIHEVVRWLTGSFSPSLLRRWPALLLTIVVAWGGVRAWQLTRPSTRVAARAWLLAETERPLRVAFEEYSVDSLESPQIGYIRAFSLARTQYETPRALAEQGIEYAVVSREIYGRFEPGGVGANRYAKEWGFYQTLFEEGELVAEFVPRWNRPGPLIRVYRLVPSP